MTHPHIRTIRMKLGCIFLSCWTMTTAAARAQPHGSVFQRLSARLHSFANAQVLARPGVFQRVSCDNLSGHGVSMPPKQPFKMEHDT